MARGRREDAARVREALRRAALGHAIPPAEAASLLAAFERLHPTPAPLGTVLVPHAWCACDHQHDVLIVSGQPVQHCQWAFCGCPGFRLRSLQPPTAPEQEVLVLELSRVLAARDLSRK